MRAGSTGSPTARGGGTPTTPADALQPASLDLLSTEKEQAHLPRTERRMLEPSSMGDVTWKPHWSHEAIVQQGQGVMDKKDPTITRNTDTDLLSMDKEQVKLPRTERRTLEPSSLGDVTWKPPWSHEARVQQGQGVMDKKDPTITRNTDTDLLSMDKEQVKPPRTERRMLGPSSLGETTWRPPWSHRASVQQGQGAADPEVFSHTV